MRPTVTAALGLVAALLAGCGPGPADPNEVVYWDTSGPAESAAFRDIAQECGRTGGYRVRVEAVAFDQALNDFKTAAQGGQGADVLRADVGWVAQLARAGVIRDLSGTPAADTSDFLPAALESTRYAGRTYAVPQVIDTLALFYDRRWLAAAGVRPPGTWDELEAVAPRLGGDRALFLNNDAYYALPFLYTDGGDLVDTRTRTITVNSPRSVRGVRKARELLDARAARTALDQPNSYATMKAAFTSGEVAMVVDGPWAVPEFGRSRRFADPANLGVAPVPGPAPVGGHDYVIRQGSRATAAATKFVECMSGTRNQARIAARIGLLPTRDSAYDAPEVARQPVVAAFRPLVVRAHDRPWIPESEELLDPLRTTYADILAGHQDTRAALDALAETYQEQVLPNYARR
ncbi:extracellular solute-binding protein [Saccharopolyspora rosea]|uniref:Extracellular solute-binding protein n=1 Tax=Saccharopolyspora rosea TaxID=524884 RepID=A0ABW3FUR3_9PSEU|nr:extracellular solute-binding protein [Saccharopolyspora rosea]